MLLPHMVCNALVVGGRRSGAGFLHLTAYLILFDTVLVTWELRSIFYVQENTTDKKALNSLCFHHTFRPI